MAATCREKIRYTSEEKAINSAKRLGKTRAIGNRRQRAYKCDTCGGYHLTSQTRWRRDLEKQTQKKMYDSYWKGRS